MKKLIIMAMLLMGCGQNSIHITQYTITSDAMGALAGSGVMGFAIQYPPEACDIYMMPKPEYGTDACYNPTLGHETRHCFEGLWHDLDRVGEPACRSQQPIKESK